MLPPTSCLSVSLFPDIMNGKMTIREYAVLCRDLGLDGFDLGVILLKNHTPRYLASVRQDMEAVGLRLHMVTTYPDFTHPLALQRARELEYLRHDIALSSELGARYLRVTAGQAHPATGTEDGITWAVENLLVAAEVADRLGVQLVFENHSKPGAWDYMDFNNRPEHFLRIAESLRGSSIAINFDTANILVAGSDDTLGVLDQVYDRVVSIHVAETATKGEMDPVALGTGLAPIPAVFSYLKARGYSGWLSLEEWGNRGVEGVRTAVSYVRETWERA